MTIMRLLTHFAAHDYRSKPLAFSFCSCWVAVFYLQLVGVGGTDSELHYWFAVVESV